MKIQKIEYPELQKVIDKRYGSKGVRLDVYVEDEAGTVYNVEIQTTDKGNLPKRTRYYQGMIDLHILERGEEYSALHRSFVIFICTYDPFGEGRWVYTFENRCREDTSLPLGDEAIKIILNTKGSVGEISEELKSFLRYMDSLVPENDFTRELDKAVSDVRLDEKWKVEYMRLNEMLRENRRLGEYSTKVSQVRKSRYRFGVDEMADIYILTPKAVALIVNAIDTHPDWDDEQIAENISFE